MFGTANRTALARILEAEWGVTPAAPAFDLMRYLGESLSEAVSTASSQEIRFDRMKSGISIIDSSPSGDVNMELSFDSFDAELEALLMGTWSGALAIAGTTGDISTAAATSKITSTTASKFADVEVGQWIELRGFTQNSGENNGYYRVTAIDVNEQELTVSPAPASDETPAGAAAELHGSMLRNGIIERSFTLVKHFQDLDTPLFHYFRGMRVGSMSLDLQTGSLVTGSFSYMGKNGELTDIALAGQSFNAAPNTEVLNAVNNIQAIYQNDIAVSEGVINSLGLQISNNHREQKGLGVLGNVGVVAGQLSVTASISQYFESKTEYQKFKDSSTFSLSKILRDADGNAYIVTLPAAKYVEMTDNAGGLDSDVILEGSIDAIRDPVTNCMVQIDKFAAA